MNDPMTTKKIHKKSSYDPHYSDNWNTPRSAYENILPFVEKYQTDHMLEKLVIWDPFFNGDGGTASEYMRDVFGPIGATIIHENVWVDLNGRIPEFDHYQPTLLEEEQTRHDEMDEGVRSSLHESDAHGNDHVKVYAAVPEG